MSDFRFTWPTSGGGPGSAPTRKYWAPLVNAESRRGNSYRLIDGDIHDLRGRLAFRYPMDLDAILAEFELAPGIKVRPGPAPSISYYLGDQYVWGMVSASEDTGGRRRQRRHAAWWREWNAAPRPRVLLLNPYALEEPS